MAVVSKLIAALAVSVLCLGQIHYRSNNQTVTSKQKTSSPALFEEVAEMVGLKFRHYNGMTGKIF